MELERIPNPSGSSGKKLLTSSMLDNSQPKLRSLLSEDPTQEEILKSFAYTDDKISDYMRRHNLVLEEWANTHAHAGNGYLLLRGAYGRVGSVVLPAAQTTVVVTHSGWVTPRPGEIQVQPMDSGGWLSATSTKFIVRAITATTFEIVVNAAPGVDVLFGWLWQPALTGAQAIDVTFVPVLRKAGLVVSHVGSPYLTGSVMGSTSIMFDWPTLVGIGRGVAFSPDGTLLAVAHDSSPFLTVIDIATGAIVTGYPTLAGSGRGVAFSPDGTLIAVAHAISPYLTVIDVATGAIVTGYPTLAGTGQGVAFSPDGTLLAVAHYTTPYLTVIDVATKATQPGWYQPPGTGLSLAWSTDPSAVITA